MEDALTASEVAGIAQTLPEDLRELHLLTDLKPDEETSTESMLGLVGRAQRLLSDFYVHLPQKRALYASDPQLRLRMLASRLEEMIENKNKAAAPGAPVPPRITGAQFHDEMTAIFTSLRDRHTIYVLPEPNRDRIAFLPFLIEECSEPGSAEPCSTYLVTKRAFGLPRHKEFKKGLVVTHWNGMQIDRAVDLNGTINAGSNSAARRARGLAMLTFRWLGVSPRPVEDWVVLTFRVDGKERHLRFPWLVVVRPRDSDPGRRKGPDVVDFDREGEWIAWVRRALYAPRRTTPESRRHPNVTWRAHSVKSSGRSYGYLRVFSFGARDAEEFRDAVAAAIQREPTDGLIIDIRGNPGGNLIAGESLLQLFTPRTITPEALEFRNTREAVTLARNYHLSTDDLIHLAKAAHLTSVLGEATATASPYFSSPPVSGSAVHNKVGQIYQAPVVLIVDASCYSTGDVFAAGFQDHKIGKVLGTSRQTGAGGGNVWTEQQVLHIFAGDEQADEITHSELPQGAGFELAVRRLNRVGDRAGVALEDLGVVVDQEHPLTRKDLLHNNADLIATAIAILEQSERRYRLGATYRSRKKEFKLTASPNLVRVDVYINDRPLQSVDPHRQPVIDVAGIKKLVSARFLGYKTEDGPEPDVAHRWPPPAPA